MNAIISMLINVSIIQWFYDEVERKFLTHLYSCKQLCICRRACKKKFSASFLDFLYGDNSGAGAGKSMDPGVSGHTHQSRRYSHNPGESGDESKGKRGKRYLGGDTENGTLDEVKVKGSGQNAVQCHRLANISIKMETLT